jgi:putative ABC transport system permease protein
MSNGTPARPALLPASSYRRGSWVLARLAIQNLGRRPARTAMLALTVAVGVAAVFTAVTLRHAIQESLDVGFSRMGADLMVVPRQTRVNLTSALLTVEPAPHTLDARLAEEVSRLPGVDRVAPQRHYHLQFRAGSHLHEVDLIAFDPARDFTVLPWLQDQLDGPLRTGDVIVGARRDEALGSEVRLAGQPLHVRGRLGVTGVGPFDRSFFVTFDTAAALAETSRTSPAGAGIDGEVDRVSALLVRLNVGSTPEQARFAIAQMPEVKVVAGTSLFTSVRHMLTALLRGAVVFTVLVLLMTVLSVGVMFSAILAERRAELGMLLAVGTRRGQLVRLILSEAVVVTSLGGLGGLVVGGCLLLLFLRSLGYWFETVGAPFLWPAARVLALYALGCVLLALSVGLLGAIVPAWRASRQEPYELVRG